MNIVRVFERQLRMLLDNPFDWPNENMAFVAHGEGTNKVIGGIIYSTYLDGDIYKFDRKKHVTIVPGSLIVSPKCNRRSKSVWSNPDVVQQIKIKQEINNSVIEIAEPIKLKSFSQAVALIKGTTKNDNLGNAYEFTVRLDLGIVPIRGTNQKMLEFSIDDKTNNIEYILEYDTKEEKEIIENYIKLMKNKIK